MIDFSGVAVAMQKLNKKLKKAQGNLCKSLEKLNKKLKKAQMWYNIGGKIEQKIRNFDWRWCWDKIFAWRHSDFKENEERMRNKNRFQ